MTKKDYERAALIVQRVTADYTGTMHRESLIEVLIELFAGNNCRFDDERFRAACVPGANVKARPKRA